MADDINHEREAQRFVRRENGEESILEYELKDGVMTITHTGVPNAMRGRGIAGMLVQTALTTARAEGWKVVPACSYAATWMERHTEFADLRA